MKGRTENKNVGLCHNFNCEHNDFGTCYKEGLIFISAVGTCMPSIKGKRKDEK